MIVVEFGNEDYGKVMKYISCIEDKAECIKEILESDTTKERKGRKRDYDDDDDDWSMRRRSRYM